MSRFVFILDPGHGGVKEGVYQTKGKRSPIWEDGSVYYEGEGNRNLVKKIGERLDNLEIEYYYTVEPEDPTDVSLSARVAFINKLKFKNKIGISIHSDAFSKPEAHGWSVFTSVGETTSDKVATIIYNEFKRVFPNETTRLDKSDGDPDKESQFYILKNTVCPMVLIENFFMTNPRECKEILMTKEGQEKIVDFVVNAIVYIENNGLK